MRIWLLIFVGVLALGVLAMIDSDTPELYACDYSPWGPHHQESYGSDNRQYVHNDQDSLLLGRDLGLDCRPTQCMELHTDYKAQYEGLCQRADGGVLENTECGNFCFYAVCLECTEQAHRNHRHRHRHQHCSLLGGCSNHYHYHTHSGSHRFVTSPCTDWFWRLYDPASAGDPSRKDGRVGRQDFSAPVSMNAAMDFGMVPQNYTPPTTDCTTERGTTEQFDGGLTPLAVPANFGRNAHRGDIMTGIQEHTADIPISDLSHLPSTPGEAGAPTLVSVTKVNDRTVRLQVSGGLNTEYRYWSYNGIRGIEKNLAGDLAVGAGEASPLVAGGTNPGPDEASPLVFRVPFYPLPLSGNVLVDPGIRGIVSFQVRSVDVNGVPSGLSNIRHQMIGMAGLRTIGPIRSLLSFSLPLPPPPPSSTPMPPPSEPGAVRPARPSLRSVKQVVGTVGIIEVTLGGNYSGNTVEYRVWDHSGFGPWDVDDVLDLSVPWLPALVTSGSFRVPGVVSDLEYPLYDPVNPPVPVIVPPPATPAFALPTPTPWPTRPAPRPPWVERSFPAPEPTPSFLTPTPSPRRSPIPVLAHFNVQVRQVDADGLPSDPSDTMVVRVWTGLYTGWDR